MREEIQIRSAVSDDADGLFLLSQFFESTATKEHLQKSISENDDEIVCVACDSSKIVGYCTGLIVKSMFYRDNRVDVEQFFVKPEYRKQGIGKALLSCVEAEAVSKGIHHFHLSTGSTNIAAQTLYHKLGYADTGEILMDKTIES